MDISPIVLLELPEKTVLRNPLFPEKVLTIGPAFEGFPFEKIHDISDWYQDLRVPAIILLAVRSGLITPDFHGFAELAEKVYLRGFAGLAHDYVQVANQIPETDAELIELLTMPDPEKEA